MHFLVPHGEIPVLNPPPFVHEDYKKFFSEEREGLLEGIVWHSPDGSMFKVSLKKIRFSYRKEIKIHVSKVFDIDIVPLCNPK